MKRVAALSQRAVADFEFGMNSEKYHHPQIDIPGTNESKVEAGKDRARHGKEMHTQGAMDAAGTRLAAWDHGQDDE